MVHREYGLKKSALILGSKHIVLFVLDTSDIDIFC